ncbi:putative hydroxymethylpyrimidine transport system substrate-binding protein [Phyllobacterium trifolii]|jgi:putative hydroxymethylpyrimidine transport system substrate-binding protein|uniref:Putative hydroxymethylpyrimidine transport system substrate-binding protein n=2 Tax=Phyllobacterium trifolii TaxID=300193 RepID=A0A839U1E8_9HYPH|nr:putative hydroxymethylpyrimidine transport system substrate-binding protein [Phyllobacterium trifolii]
MFRIHPLIFMIGLAVSAFGISGQAMAADKLTVLLEWFVNPDHAPLVIAKEKGYFAGAGLDVELIPPADPAAPPRLVAAKQADIAIHYQPTLFLDHDEGLPLVRFGTLVETPLNTVMTLADGPIKSLKDLKGKKVGFSVAGFEDAMLGAMLKAEGLSTKDVELINVNFALSTSLITGQVDATVGAYRNFELTQMAQEGHKGLAFFPEEHGVPPYDELIFVTHPDLLKDDRLKRFLAAVEKGAIYLTNHPDESWQLFVKAYPDLDNPLNKQAWIDTLPRFAKRPAALDRGRYERFGVFMHDAGLIKSVPKVEEIAVELY